MTVHKAMQDAVAKVAERSVGGLALLKDATERRVVRASVPTLYITDYSGIDEALIKTADEWCDHKIGMNMIAFSERQACDLEGLRKEVIKTKKQCAKTDQKDDVPKLQSLEDFAVGFRKAHEAKIIRERQRVRAQERLKSAVAACLDSGFTDKEIVLFVGESFVRS